ncbi:MAG: TrbI/VirB10 family protein, partial [Burkholderiales bacterium]
MKFPFPSLKKKPVNEIVQDEPEIERIDGERGMPSVNKKRSIGGRMRNMVMIGALAVTVLIMVGKVYLGIVHDRKAKEQEVAQKSGKLDKKQSSTVPPFPENDLYIPPPPVAPPATAGLLDKVPNGGKKTASGETEVPGYDDGQGPVLVGEGGNESHAGSSGGQREMTPEERALHDRLSSPVQPGNVQMVSDSMKPVPMPKSGESNGGLFGGGGGGMAGALKATYTPEAQAKLLPDRDFVVPKGSFLDCTLETEIDSSLSGMTACTLARDVYSDSGRVVLMEKGTKVTGEYRGDMKPGQARLFILWTRAETPKGVIVDLASVGTDRLGRTGVTGYVDSHFWDRWGAAV